jgi:DmsE family decaheme c-type cytochrome
MLRRKSDFSRRCDKSIEGGIFMHRDGPQTQVPIDATPGKGPGLRASLILMLGASILCVTALAAPATKADSSAKPATAQTKDTNPADFVGAEICASCHEAEAKGFANNPHTKIALEHGKTEATCESCHGAGKAHVEGGGDIAKIFDPAKATSKQVDQTCLGCHAGAHPDFERSPHAKASVGCTGCHSIHKSEDAEHLLRASQPRLCFQCHTDEKPQFDMPTHHKVNEGLVKCSDCHDVHGTFEKSNLRSRNDSNLICTKCHAEMRGPFVYEHTPVKGEGCLGCHTPHGSQNARLLNMPSINTLCNQCHSPVAAGTVHGMNAGSSELTPCTDCHTMIHGSNMNVAFIR